MEGIVMGKDGDFDKRGDGVRRWRDGGGII